MLKLADFKGRWQLQRRIDDRLAVQVGRFEGHADFVADDDGLGYTETGDMRLGEGPKMTAIRRYHWTMVADRVVVTFADGGAFHSFAPAGHAAGTEHPCGDDHYRVAYDFTHWPDWTATWDVAGPRKDYTSVSRYRR